MAQWINSPPCANSCVWRKVAIPSLRPPCWTIAPLLSTLESGARASYEGAQRTMGNTVHRMDDTLGHLLALRVTAANEQDRAQVGGLAESVQAVAGESVDWV